MKAVISVIPSGVSWGLLLWLTEEISEAATSPLWGLPGGAVVKDPHANAADLGTTVLISGLGRCSGGGHGNPLQYSHLENPMDRGALQAIVHGVTKSWTWLSARARTHASPLYHSSSTFAGKRAQMVILWVWLTIMIFPTICQKIHFYQLTSITPILTSNPCDIMS